MKRTPNGWLRFLAWGGLWLVIGLLTIPTFICQLVTGAGLAMIEPLKAKADELLN